MEKEKREDVPLQTAYSQNGRYGMQPKARQSSRAGAAKTRTETFELVEEKQKLLDIRAERTREGGMKAVLWTDVFQAILMFAALFAIIIKGLLLLGGIRNIFEIANEGGRLIIPRFNLDPEVHYSMFNVFAQGMIITMSEYAGSQIQVQRLRTLKNLNKSKLATFFSIPMLVSFQLFCCFCGLIIYAYFRSCDPLTSPDSPIESPDQIVTTASAILADPTRVLQGTYRESAPAME
ncbi:putative sodium-dependent multivitamin transporter [Trichonephila clavipes]|nr:putative sodium-dependent multivitamin transporter [Trichonephila clavipes]